MLTSRVHTTAKQVISRRRKIENVFKLSKDENCTCKACKNTVFHCQICKFVGFLLPSSSWLLKLPSYKSREHENGDKIEVANFLQPNSSLFLIFGSKTLCFVEDYCCGLYEDYYFSSSIQSNCLFVVLLLSTLRFQILNKFNEAWVSGIQKWTGLSNLSLTRSSPLPF